MRWVLEAGVFSTGDAFAAAAARAGHAVTAWDEAWAEPERAPRFAGETVGFRGNLADADRVRRTLPWAPGAWCATDAFHCTAWYPRAARWLLHQGWQATTASRLVAAPPAADAVFVRPDSPLKPFSGRVVRTAGLTLAALDCGFYYDDPALPVIVAPVRSVVDEWRFLVVAGRVVAGSAYDASAGRRPLPAPPSGAAWAFAQEVAASLVPPEPIYVLDVCLADGALHVLELNPFSGADLYAADPDAVVAAVADHLQTWSPGSQPS